MADDPDKQDLAVETPIGKLAAKGVRISDLIGLLTFVAVAGAGAILYQHHATGLDRDQAMVATMKEISTTSKQQIEEMRLTSKEQVEEMRMQTCILMLDQNERKREMNGESRLCSRVVRGLRK